MNDELALYEWHASQWDKILSYKEQLPHAILLAGPQGLGKIRFANYLAKYILCKNTSSAKISNDHEVPNLPSKVEAPCDDCSSCRLIKSATNPDLRLAESSKAGQLLIESIAEIKNFLQHSSHLGGAKVAIIPQAEKMNRSSSNALLKILEEPPPRKYIILTTGIVSNLLPTIISRCVRLHFVPPPVAVSKRWVLDNVPGRNQDLLTNDVLLDINNRAPLALADMLQSGKGEAISRFSACLRALKGGHKWTNINLADYKELELLEMVDVLLWELDRIIKQRLSKQDDEAGKDNSRLFNLRDIFMKRRMMLLAKINLNKDLLLEECLILWQGVVHN